jgi:hypothetical protein
MDGLRPPTRGVILSGRPLAVAKDLSTPRVAAERSFGRKSGLRMTEMGEAPPAPITNRIDT